EVINSTNEFVKKPATPSQPVIVKHFSTPSSSSVTKTFSYSAAASLKSPLDETKSDVKKTLTSLRSGKSWASPDSDSDDEVTLAIDSTKSAPAKTSYSKDSSAKASAIAALFAINSSPMSSTR